MAERLKKRDIKEDELVAAMTAARDFVLRNRTALLLVCAVVVVGIIVVIAVSHSRAEARREVQTQLSEALLLMQGLAYQRAALQLESLLERHPGGPLHQDVLHHCATAQFMSGNYQRALEIFERLAAGKKNDPERSFGAREGIANCQEQMGNFQLAAEIYERIAPEAPGKERVPMILARAAACYEQAGAWDSMERVGDRLANDFGQSGYWFREGTRFVARARVLRALPGD